MLFQSPGVLPTRKTVESARGTLSVLPSTRFTTTTRWSNFRIVPRMSRPPPCANAMTGKIAASTAALMMFIFRSSLQESLVLFLFLAFVGADRIHPFHLFDLGRRNLRQMPYEMHEFPIVFHVVFIAPRGHARDPHAVLDDVKHFAVAEPLRARLAHVGDARIKVRSHFRLAAAIVGVADGAMIGEV